MTQADDNKSREQLQGEVEALRQKLAQFEQAAAQQSRVEDALWQSEQRYITLVEQAPMGVQVFEMDGTLLQVNSTWERMWGVSAEHVVKIHNALHDPQIKASPIYADIQRVFNGENVQIPDTLYDPAASGMPGKRRWVRTHSYHLRDRDEKPTHVVLVSEDITARKAVEEELSDHRERLEQLVAGRTQELEVANKQLRDLGRVKDEFISNVSHELRTPIASLLTYLRLLAENPDAAQTYLETMTRETQRLKRIIEDLLRLSRLDQHQAEVELAPVDLNVLVTEYVHDRSPLASEKNLKLALKLEDGLPYVSADRELLGQALSNLLTNALNYTPEGGNVTVETARKKLNGVQWAGFSVRDDGPGIDSAEQPRLFERFFRGKVARASGTSGTGLGLAIVNEIANVLNARVTIESSGVPGEGSLFAVWLPLVDE